MSSQNVAYIMLFDFMINSLKRDSSPLAESSHGYSSGLRVWHTAQDVYDHMDEAQTVGADVYEIDLPGCWKDCVAYDKGENRTTVPVSIMKCRKV